MLNIGLGTRNYLVTMPPRSQALMDSIPFILPQCDEQDQKVNKLVWDDYSKNPMELLQAVLDEIPDWKEGIEMADGILRKNISNYEEPVIRELVVNALVYRPYTTKGDIFINLFPDRLDALIVEDLTKFEKSSISEIQQRIGQEIPMRTIRYQLNQLIDKQKIKREGEKKGTRYFIDK